MREPIDSSPVSILDQNDRATEIQHVFDSLTHVPERYSSDTLTTKYKLKYLENEPLLDSLASDPTYQTQVFSLMGEMLDSDAEDDIQYHAMDFVLKHKKQTREALSGIQTKNKFIENLMYTAMKKYLIRPEEDTERDIKEEVAALVIPILLEDLPKDLANGYFPKGWGLIGSVATEEQLLEMYDKIAPAFIPDTPESVNASFLLSVYLGNIAKDSFKLYAFLEKFKLPPGRIIYDWDIAKGIDQARAFSRHEPNRTHRKNLERLMEIELRRPGISEFLYSKYGITDFGRYPAEILIDQFDSRYDTDSAYGVILFPKDDYNGAFYQTDYLHYFFMDTRRHNYKIRIFECGDKKDVISALNSSRRQFGKIHFALIGGHGTESSIALGEDSQHDPNQLISISDLLRPGAPAVTQAFIENPTIILKSCSTGAKDGIAQKMSGLGAKVYAPDSPTNIKSLKFNIENGEEVFDVEYMDKLPTIKYAAGEKTD